MWNEIKCASWWAWLKAGFRIRQIIKCCLLVLLTVLIWLYIWLLNPIIRALLIKFPFLHFEFICIKDIRIRQLRIDISWDKKNNVMDIYIVVLKIIFVYITFPIRLIFLDLLTFLPNVICIHIISVFPLELFYLSLEPLTYKV